MFSSDRLVYRRLVPDDAPAVLAYRSLPEVARYQGWEPTDQADIHRFIAEQQTIEPDTPHTWCQLALILASSGELVGDLGLHFLAADSRTVELGITVAPSHQGQGYATEALTAAIDHVFGTLGKHRVYGSVDPRNAASRALLERIGMRQEAHMRESLRFKGEWADDMIYALLAREWPTGR